VTEANERDPAAIVQGAALEAIKAFRTFLDVAEGVVRDPQQAVVVGKAFADAARSVFDPHAHGAPVADEQDEHGQQHEQHEQDDGAQTRVRRIHVD
jgi:hypothetical protein